LYGKKLKVLLGSPSIKEGVSLTAVRQVHILEPYWNQARLDQVIGRASRYCSHKDLPEEERVVDVFIYVAIHEPNDLDDSNETIKSPQTVDEYIQQLSEQKNKLVKEFEKAIKEAAVDCTINKNANDPDIKCVK
jgi:SNF2 family DNA or RNA helicase